MLVLISDLHLTDGTTCANIGPDAFTLLADRLRDMAYRASWRVDGRYYPIEGIDLILVGDVFDLLHSTRWAEGTPGPENPIRPWDNPHNPAFTATIADIVAGILQQNAESIAILNKMTTGKVIAIPVNAKTQVGGERSGKRQPVPVHIHYMTGNHDWYFHLPGTTYDAIRQKVVDAVGLANSPQLFPYHLEELPALETICRAHGVYTRHGDFYDPINYDKSRGRDAAALGDAIAVELIDRFPAVVNAALGQELTPEFIRNLREIVNVRPALLVPAWVEGLLRRNCQPNQARRVKEIWNSLVDQFLREPFVRSFDNKFAFDAVDALETILIFSKGTSLEFLSNLMTYITQKFWGGNLSFSKNAFQEHTFQDRTTRYIVYGHTHSQEVVPLNVYEAGGQRVNQFCFNTGTWHVLHSAARYDPQALQFVGYNHMSYVAFYRGDERRGKSFETWSGTLAWE